MSELIAKPKVGTNAEYRTGLRVQAVRPVGGRKTGDQGTIFSDDPQHETAWFVKWDIERPNTFTVTGFHYSHLAIIPAQAEHPTHVPQVGTRPQITEYVDHMNDNLMTVYSLPNSIQLTIGGPSDEPDEPEQDLHLTKEQAVTLVNDLMKRIVWLDNNGN
jgi:hypothetical protein